MTLLSHEYETKLRIGYIGAGEHSFRNILPCFQYAAVELVALADQDTERGLAVARQFGARHFYPNHKAMLAKEEMDAVMVVLGPDAEGRPTPAIAADALRAGFHVWFDMPPCANKNDVSTLTQACMRKSKWAVAGFKRMFAPAYLKVAEIISTPEFGGVTSFSMRYPVFMPPDDQQSEDHLMAPFLEALHPYSLLMRLFGDARGIMYMRNDSSGGAVLSLRYRNGVVGTLHLTAGQAATSPLERLEVIGNGANVVVENASRLTYYRPGGVRGKGQFGRDDTFIGADSTAPIIWEPEFSLGQLYNKPIFMQGYVGAIQYFAEHILTKTPPKHGNLVDILHMMTLYDKIRAGKENTYIEVY